MWATPPAGPRFVLTVTRGGVQVACVCPTAQFPSLTCAQTATVARDHSAGDMCFAANAGLPFHTAEAFFGGSRAPRDTAPFAPWAASGVFLPARALPRRAVAGGGGPPLPPLYTAGEREVVVLVAPPACGKSTLAVSRLPRHTRVNQDTLGTRPRCVAAAEAALATGAPVVIDATNGDPDTRATWVAVARKAGVPARAVVLNVPKEVAVHLNALRAGNPLGGADGAADRRAVPDIALFTMFKRFTPPTAAEGFASVINVPFVIAPDLPAATTPADTTPADAVAAALYDALLHGFCA